MALNWAGGKGEEIMAPAEIMVTGWEHPEKESQTHK
jgi:hypothetical protein